MRENTLKQKLKKGKAVFGTMLTFPSATMVEMLGSLGYDWILLDNEHGDITVENAENMIRAAELTGMAPIVRPIGNELEFICPFLDRFRRVTGVQGFAVVPNPIPDCANVWVVEPISHPLDVFPSRRR